MQKALAQLHLVPVNPFDPALLHEVQTRDEARDRYVHLYFLEEDAVSVWDERFAGLGDDFAAAGLGQVVFASPFRATEPGTDAFTDELW